MASTGAELLFLRQQFEDRHVGEDGGDAPHRLVTRAGLADDLEVLFAVEQVGKTAANDLVVIEQEQPNRRSGASGGHE